MSNNITFRLGNKTLSISKDSLSYFFCHLFPPSINSISSFVVNLPFIFLFMGSLPIRFFLCTVVSLSSIPIYPLIANLFPPSTLFCSVCPSSQYTCYQNCPSCQTSIPCVSIPTQYTDFCSQTFSYWSIWNTIFCLSGSVLLILAYPLIEFINLIISPLNVQICYTVDPNNCLYGIQCEQNGD